MSDINVSFQEEIDWGNEKFRVEFEIQPLVQFSEDMTPQEIEVIRSIRSIEEQEKILEERLNELNSKIERLTNHADGTDYIVAASCGILCGLFDSFFVGEIDYKESLQKATNKINQTVEEKAQKIYTSETVEKAVKGKIERNKKKGIKLSKEEIENIRKQTAETVKVKFEKVKAADERDGTQNALRRAISKLEGHYKLITDNSHKGVSGTGPKFHHLDELAHHPSFIGMMAAIMGELIRVAVIVDKNGHWNFKFIKGNSKEWAKVFIPVVVSGILAWILPKVKNKNKEKLDKSIPKPIQNIILSLSQTPAAITIIEIVKNWMGHLASDMAGTHSNPGAGMGIPGMFLSSLKELSSMPPFCNTNLPNVVHDLFVKQKIDFRAELGYLQGAIDTRQWLPVLFGDLIVRLFYFIRRLVLELRDGKKIEDVDWRKVIPFNNRTIARLMLIESGVFSATDMIDAAVRSALKNGTPRNPLFWKDLILRINIVGLGRFAVAIPIDATMGVKRHFAIQERMGLVNKQLLYQNAKVYYNQELMWISAQKTQKALESLAISVEQSVLQLCNMYQQMEQGYKAAMNNLVLVKEHEPDFYDEMMSKLL